MKLFVVLDKISSGVLFGFDVLFAGVESRDGLKVRDGIHELLYQEAGEKSLDRIDSKAGSLLTHISMMIAIATFVVSSSETALFEQIVIGSEIIIYLFLAMCCLRCLVFVDVPARLRTLSGGGDLSVPGLVRKQAVMRALILNFAIRWTFVVTFLFALTLAAHLIL